MSLARAIAVLVAALVLHGCGGGEPAARAQDGRVAVTLDEFLISPQDIELTAGRVTFDVVDRGRLRHSFRLWGPGGEPVAVKSLFPGDHASRTAILRPGEYRMVCTIMNHAELGMTGKLVVR
jgi:plastocyanin